ncbi:ATP-binding cassette domain-containing protein [Paractinoplanes durhamensis]|uniref:Daunorubicin resistance protein DrrA family ABC transporter ATP-binding protein n=1 Tax=Paractinoplanes durhamensis TaxID=113563 RepID=A0ABQ3YYV8_9ACTN|nr:ATP-binding cassette domain-containing protein [Actinoplanes durhamensis]GIE02772.1 daunorubicin resistance protein DrrA family ABC transporter ATP-binding protein [Actinoplanes durhamensis]
MRDLAIEAEGLTRRFGTTTAVDQFDLTVPAGTVHGLLGPNGAGKTTAVRILTTLLRPDAGHARVAGHDVVREADRVRARIGLVGQQAALDEQLSGRQNLEMFGRLHHLGAARARHRAGELLERFGLADAADRPAAKYSGGMRRRLDLAAGLLIGPAVLFLDEPTTGLDPRGRNEVWREIRALVTEGTTVLLTTQYLEEADQLADAIAVIDHGRVIAAGPPDELKGAYHLDVVVRDTESLDRTAELLTRIGAGDPQIDPDQRRVSVPVGDRVAALTEAALALRDHDVEDIALRRPTLDEVFLSLTDERSAA